MQSSSLLDGSGRELQRVKRMSWRVFLELFSYSGCTLFLRRIFKILEFEGDWVEDLKLINRHELFGQVSIWRYCSCVSVLSA